MQTSVPSSPLNAQSNEGACRLRTEAMYLLQRCNEEEQFKQPSTKNTDEMASNCAINRFIRACPPLADPNWAMEELMRISHNNASYWNRSALPSSVWAPPGTPQCPFGTKPTDFVECQQNSVTLTLNTML